MSGSLRARVIGRTGASEGITHDMADEARIGRSPDNDIVINSPFLSGHHARIYAEGGSHWVEDLGSRNGTRVDGVAIGRPVCLERLHVITLADEIDLVYVRAGARATAGRAPAAPAAGSAAPAGAPPSPGAGAPPASAPKPAAAPSGSPPSPPSETVYDLQFDPLIDPRGPAAAGTAGASAEPETKSPERREAPSPEEATPPPAGAGPGVFAERTMISGLDAAPLIDPRQAAAHTSPAKTPLPAPGKEYALILTQPDGVTASFPLKRGENSLGRSADCDVMLPDPERWLSRHHATLTIREDGATLADNDTMNGTFIAGVQIRSVEIAPDTTFRLGPNTELKFVEK